MWGYWTTSLSTVSSFTCKRHTMTYTAKITTKRSITINVLIFKILVDVNLNSRSTCSFVFQSFWQPHTVFVGRLSNSLENYVIWSSAPKKEASDSWVAIFSCLSRFTNSVLLQQSNVHMNSETAIACFINFNVFTVKVVGDKISGPCLCNSIHQSTTTLKPFSFECSFNVLALWPVCVYAAPHAACCPKVLLF